MDDEKTTKRIKQYLKGSPSYGAMIVGMPKVTVEQLANVLALTYRNLGLRSLEQDHA